MEEGGFFQRALAHFTYEAAGGGAIRHLADMGYTAGQIVERLDYPVPYEKVRQAVWEHFIDRGVILLEEPGNGSRREKAVYVREYDKFGKPSFRRVAQEEDGAVACWKELPINCGEVSAEEISALLRAKLEVNGKDVSYASCDFGLAAKREPERYHAMLSALHERLRQYVAGLPWEGRRVYHKLDVRMAEILTCLCEAGQYQGELYFLKTQEKVKLYVTL